MTPCGSLYDIDEVRMLGRAATPAEVHDWATNVEPRATTFGGSAAADLRAAGEPAIGNASFGVRVQGTAQRLFVLAAGLGYERWQGVPLPLDPATLLPVQHGALLQVAADVATVGMLDGEGAAVRAMPLPPVPGLRGAGLYLQAFVLRGDNGLDHSAALALSIGE